MKPTPAKSPLPGVDQRFLLHIPVIFAVLCGVLGVVYAIIVPPLQVPDESLHFFRAYGLSEGQFVAPALTPIPASVAAFTHRFPPHVENVGRITAGELSDALRDPLNPSDQVMVPDPNANVNPWIPYLPSATLILFARVLHASPLAVCYLGRLGNLAAYVFLTWLALRILPAGHLVLFTVALMPMTLHQAASLSWDSIAFGIAFLFCAVVLQARQNSRPLDYRYCCILWLGVLVLSVCKLDFALLPLLLLIRGKQYRSRQTQVSFLLICALSAFAINAFWQHLNRENFLLYKEFISAQNHTNLPDNIWYLYYNTGYVINALGRSVAQNGFLYLTQFVGTFGWLTVKLPPFVVWLYVAQMLLVGLAGLSDFRISRIERGIVAGVVIMGCFGATLATWLWTPDFYIKDAILHNVGTLWGIQGRYYILFAFAAILLLSNRALRLRPFWLGISAVLVILFANGVAIAQIKQTYYAPVAQALEPLKSDQPGK